MALALLIGTLSLPLVVYLLQEYRDVRGKQRNRAGRCYRCGELMSPPFPVVSIQNWTSSTLYFYCTVCANGEDRKAGIWISILGIAVGVTLAAIALKHSESSLWSALFLGAASVLIVALIPLGLLKRRKTKPLGSVEASKFPVWKSDPDLIAETKRLLASENDPKARAALQHVLDLATNLDKQATAARARLQRGVSQ